MKKVFIFSVVALLGLIACDKDDAPSNGVLNVQLTDAPGDYEEVLIDVQEVKINIKGEEEGGGWTTLENVNTGIYNLLDFTNGKDTTLVNEELPAGRINQMRLVLGTNNRVKVNGEYHDLKTPSAQQSGLKFNIHADIAEGVTYKMWIDFDAARSVVKKGNGEYSLKPVIRTYTEATSGSISGVVMPLESEPYVIAINADNDSTGTYANDSTGQFVLGGLPGGLYFIAVVPGAEGYDKLTVEEVSVTVGETTELDTLIVNQTIE